MEWFNKIYKIKNQDFILRISINELHKKRVSEILKYWSKITNIPLSQFTKTSFIKTKLKKHYKNRDTYFGTLRVKVKKGTDLRRKIIGSIEALKAFAN